MRILFSSLCCSHQSQAHGHQPQRPVTSDFGQHLPWGAPLAYPYLPALNFSLPGLCGSKILHFCPCLALIPLQAQFLITTHLFPACMEFSLASLDPQDHPLYRTMTEPVRSMNTGPTFLPDPVRWASPVSPCWPGVHPGSCVAIWKLPSVVHASGMSRNPLSWQQRVEHIHMGSATTRHSSHEPGSHDSIIHNFWGSGGWYRKEQGFQSQAAEVKSWLHDVILWASFLIFHNLRGLV